MILQGDAGQVPLADASIDAVVCDPPYVDQLTMFGKTLGHVKKDRRHSEEETLLAWMTPWARELHRVLKVGGTMFVFSSHATFRYWSSVVPPILLDVTALSPDDDHAWFWSPTRLPGVLDAAGFTFERLHAWVYGTGNPRGTTLKPAWEAIIEVRKARTPPPGPPVMQVDLFPTLRERLASLDPKRRRLAAQILATPDFDQQALYDRPEFQGMFDHLTHPFTSWKDFHARTQAIDVNPGEWFWVPKPSVDEQNAGLEDLPARRIKKFGAAKIPRQNTHPTPKPVKLMRTLVARACPAGGIVLDPFTGSGSTGIACAYEGRRFIGLERNAEYLPIATRRIAYAHRHA